MNITIRRMFAGVCIGESACTFNSRMLVCFCVCACMCFSLFMSLSVFVYESLFAGHSQELSKYVYTNLCLCDLLLHTHKEIILEAVSVRCGDIKVASSN